MRAKIATFVIFLVLSGTTNATAQTRIRVADPGCQSCGIAVTKLFTAGGLDDPSSMSRPNTAALNSRGELLVAYPDSRGQFFVYGPDGSFRKAIGRRGTGPGEFNLIRHIRVARGDTVHVADLDLRRSILAPDFRFLRSTRYVLNSDDFEPLARDTILVAGNVNTRAAIGLPLHLFFDPQDMLSFGADRPNQQDDLSAALRRVIALHPGGSTFWAASMTSYTIQQFDRSGKLLRTLYREADWFEPYSAPFRVSTRQPPQPRISDIRVDSEGLVWVLIHVADPEWKKAVRLGPRNGGQQFYGLTSDEEYWDTVIEVIDPDAARTVASIRLPDYMKLFIGNGETFSYREDSDGTPWLDVWRVSVSTGRGK